jgi:PII-like signaling protein
MDRVEDAVMLRIYLGESDHDSQGPTYKTIVHLLRARGIWGATVTRGIYGFGKRSIVHAAAPLQLSQDLPIVIEAVDSRRKIQSVLPEVAPLVRDGLVVTLRVEAIVRLDDSPSRTSDSD